MSLVEQDDFVQLNITSGEVTFSGEKVSDS